MSMYGDYIKEHHGDEILENDKGFATYRYLDGGMTVYIVDIYVRPDFRKENVASVIADEIAMLAKKKGCNEMLGSVVPFAKNATASLKILLSYGFELKISSSDLILFRKDL